MLALTLTDRAVLVEFLRQLLLGLPSSSVNTIASWAFAEALETSLKGRPHPNPTTLSGDFDLTYIRPRPFRPVSGVSLPASIWSGSISFGLISIPVRLAVAAEKKDLAFHMLDRASHTMTPSCTFAGRIRFPTDQAVCGERAFCRDT